MLRQPMKTRETLRSYVNRVFEETADISEVKVSVRAKRLGHTISPGYVSNLRTGKAKNPSMDLLKALAAGLGKTEDEVIAVARGKQLSEEAGYQESVFAELWNEYRHLTPAQQKEVKPIIEMVVREVQRRLT